MSDNSLRTGDFPGFFALGALAWDHDIHGLYDPEQQRHVQNAAFPEMQGTFHWPLYPAYDALILAPLTLLPARAAQVMFVTFNFICYLFALRLVIPQVSSLKETLLHPFSITFLLFPPLLLGVFGGQNTGASMLCYAVLIFSVQKEARSGTAYEGLALGLWMMKPQYAIPALVAAALLRRWKTLSTAFLIAAFLWSLAALKFGADWVLIWISILKQYSVANGGVNSDAMINFSRVIAQSGSANSIVWIGMVTLSIGCCASVLFSITQSLRNKNSKAGATNIVALLGSTILLFNAQASFYDLGLALLPLLSCSHKQKSIWLTGFWLTGAFAFTLRGSLPISLFWLPATVALCGVFFMNTNEKNL